MQHVDSFVFQSWGDVVLLFGLLVVLGLLVLLFVWLAGPRTSLRPRPSRLFPRDATGWTLLIDGSNFARRNGPDGREDPRLEHLLEVIEVLRVGFHGAEFIVFCDANLRHVLDAAGDKAAFLELVRCGDGRFRETHGKRADDVILEHARQHPRCIVVSNDRFRDEDHLAARVGVMLLRVNDRPPISIHTCVDHYPDPAKPTRNVPCSLRAVLPPLNVSDDEEWPRAA